MASGLNPYHIFKVHHTTVPQSLWLKGFFCNMSAIWIWEYCKQEACAGIVLLQIFRAHSSKEMWVLFLFTQRSEYPSLWKKSLHTYTGNLQIIRFHWILIWSESILLKILCGHLFHIGKVKIEITTTLYFIWETWLYDSQVFFPEIV